MAQLTSEIELSADWQIITANGFVGQKDIGSVVEICNASSLPSGTVPRHKISEGTNLQYPQPLSGNWYIRALQAEDTSIFTFTEI